jgi:sulfur relay (sulfurtransferase) DsrF/TusC family protein
VWFCMVSVMPVVQAVHIRVLLNECWLFEISHFLIEDKSFFQMNMSTTDNIENCNGMLTVDLLRTIHVYDTIISTPGT